MLLSHWGHLVLHASAVALGGQAVAFVGHSGDGKSTLAATLRHEGGHFITDDILLLSTRGREYSAVPSYAEQRMWEDSASALFGGQRERASVAHYTDKVSVNLAHEGGGIAEEPVPLARIYVLATSEPATEDEIAVEPFTLSEAYVRLLDQTFRLDITDKERMRLEVSQLGDLVRAIPVRRLSYPRDYDALPRVRQAILRDLEQ